MLPNVLRLLWQHAFSWQNEFIEILKSSAAAVVVSLASEQQRKKKTKKKKPLPGPQVLTFIQAFNCDVICMSPLSRSCGALSLSSICRSFFLPPGGSGGCGLDAADGDERPSSEAKRDWSDFLSCFLGLCCGYNKSVFFFMRVSGRSRGCVFVCVCV